MNTFDRTVTINAPPHLVCSAIRRMHPAVYVQDHLMYFCDEDALWNVFYWQPDTDERTYLRFIVTPMKYVDERLSNAPNLIRALDELEQPIPFEASELAYERLETIKNIGSAFPTLPENPKPQILRLSDLFPKNFEVWIPLLLVGFGAFVFWFLCPIFQKPF